MKDLRTPLAFNGLQYPLIYPRQDSKPLRSFLLTFNWLLLDSLLFGKNAVTP